ncbi:3-keto-disaccharide hydrolase, partial [Cesiribacter andamanensis]|uniref:3-keto-disaccharide hydrolase n=1 Tax=Cesiribacter andamanensis TaxID=649507 RepID=UPI000590129D
MLKNTIISRPPAAWLAGAGALLLSTFLGLPLQAQQAVSLDDLSAFQNPGPSWQIVGDVRADLQKANAFTLERGRGVLVNLPERKKPGIDLLTSFEHADMDLELEYMMAKGANSGIYLQGLYEVQLEDSWGHTTPTFANNGGVYERWDERKPEGQRGYEGYAPRQNVSKAPGLWQKLKISYQAPRFDASGTKTENARLLRVEMNGVLLHENLELSGPTRGALSQQEGPRGPLRLQGDHGAVAFRNIQITHYDKPRPELQNLRYTVYQGQFDAIPQYDSLPPEAEGSAVILTSSLSPLPDQFLLRYQATLRIHEPGEYRFNL